MSIINKVRSTPSSLHTSPVLTPASTPPPIDLAMMLNDAFSLSSPDEDDDDQDNNQQSTISSFHLFHYLGDEIKLHIFSFLSLPDLLSLSRCSKGTRAFVTDPVFWYNQFTARGWTLPINIKITKDVNLMSYYYDKLNITSHNSFNWNSIGLLNGKTPTKRYKHSSSVYKHFVVMIGGQETNSKRFSEIIYFDTKTNTFNKPAIKGDAPPKFSRHTARTIDKKVYIFGGYNGSGTYYDLATYNLETKTWKNVPAKRLKGDIPQSRSNHSAAAIGNKYYIFSGNKTSENGDYFVLNDFCCLDTYTRQWTNIQAHGDVPNGRGGHVMEVINGKIYLFGGGVWHPTNGWVTRYNDIHIYDPSTNTWTKPSVGGELPNISTFPASFVYGRFLVLFGGGCQDTNRVTNRIHAFDTISHTWVKLSNDNTNDEPKPRDMSTASVINNQVYLICGYSGGAVEYLDRLEFNYLAATNPSGKLVQIEHALHAASAGGSAIGIKVDGSSVQKISMITENVGLVYAGMGPDSRVLIKKARKEAEKYYKLYHEKIPVLQLVRELASIMQEFTQSGGVRPFGVSLLVAGFDEKGPHLYQVDPSGSYFAWKATAIGKNMINSKTFLEKRYNDELEIEDAIQTALITLKEGFETQLTESNMELAIIKADQKFKILSPSEIKDYLANL
eukprot:gene15011-17752_t